MDAPRRFDGLDGYRGVAALLVVAYHAWMHASPWPTQLFGGTPLHALFRNLEAGVAVFFVLSGFLLFLPFARAAVEARERPAIREFLARRAWRILPLYYVAFLALWLLRFGGTAPELWSLAEHLTFTHGFSREHIFWTIGPAWSLAVEALFYLMLAGLGPLTWLACRGLGQRRARVAVALIPALGVGAVSLWYKWDAFAVRHVPLDDWPVYFGLLARMDGFAPGMALAVACAAWGAARMPRPAAWGLRAAGLGLIAWTFAAREGNALVGLYFHSLCAAGAALLVAPTVFAPVASRWEGALACRPLRWLGAISYSVYLWHEAILVELAPRGWILRDGAAAFWPNLGALLALAILAGSLSHVLIERPVLRWRAAARRRRATPPPAAAEGTPLAPAQTPAATAPNPEAG